MRKPHSHNYRCLKWAFFTMQSFCIHSFFLSFYEQLWFWSLLFYCCYRAPPCLWLNFRLYQEENVGMLDSPSPVSFLMHRLRAPVQGLLICWSTIVPSVPQHRHIHNRKDRAIQPLEFWPVFSVLCFTCHVTKQWFTFGFKGGWIYAFAQYVFDIAIQYQISHQ